MCRVVGGPTGFQGRAVASDTTAGTGLRARRHSSQHAGGRGGRKALRSTASPTVIWPRPTGWRRSFICWGRLARASEVAQGVLFLCSESRELHHRRRAKGGWRVPGDGTGAGRTCDCKTDRRIPSCPGGVVSCCVSLRFFVLTCLAVICNAQETPQPGTLVRSITHDHGLPLPVPVQHACQRVPGATRRYPNHRSNHGRVSRMAPRRAQATVQQAGTLHDLQP